MRNKKIKTFYTDKQVCFDSIKEKSFSQSPLKPALLIEKIKKGPYSELLEITADFEPIAKEDFEIAVKYLLKLETLNSIPNA